MEKCESSGGKLGAQLYTLMLFGLLKNRHLFAQTCKH